MEKIYTEFAYYGKNAVIEDILDFCRENPMHLDFGELVDLKTGGLVTSEAYICLTIDCFDYALLNEFVLVAELMREV